MSRAITTLIATPARVRALPFAIYMTFLVVESLSGLAASEAHWLYGAQVVATAVVLAALWPRLHELHAPAGVARFGDPRALLAAVAVGVLVFLAWRLLDQPWLAVGSGRPLEPARELLAREPGFALTRLVGAIVLVPVMEELFWRSFVMRWAQSADFLALAPARIGLRALLVSAALFAIEHHLVAAGFVAGLAYGELYRRTGNLWVVIVAHAITNALLEIGPAARPVTGS